MKVLIHFFLLIFSVTFSIICNPPASAEICNRIVAAVNTDIITLYELDGKIKELTGRESADLANQNRTGFVETRQRILGMLIDEKLAQKKINELGIAATPKEIENTIERIKTKNLWTQEDLESSLKMQGITLNKYKKSVKNDIEQMRLIDYEIRSKIIIRDESIKKHYNEHIDEFSTENKVHLALILLLKESPPSQNNGFTPFQKSDEIVSRLKNGEDFAVLALQFSQGPGAEDGGDIGFIQISQLDPKLKTLANSMETGEVSQPIMTAAGIQFIKILDKQKKGVKTLEEVKNQIYSILFQQEVNKKFAAWIGELKKESFIKIIF